jgi:hypothetical protein
MGRGRAKAKQTKVARELKYSSPNTDLERLQRELSGGSDSDPDGDASAEPYGDDGDYSDQYDGERWAPSGRK